MKGHFEREGRLQFFVLTLPLLILLVGTILIIGFRIFHL